MLSSYLHIAQHKNVFSYIDRSREGGKDRNEVNMENP